MTNSVLHGVLINSIVFDPSASSLIAVAQGVDSVKALVQIIPATTRGHYPPSFWQGNTHIISLTDLQKASSGDVVTGAAVTLNLSVGGVGLAGILWPLALDESEDTPGKYSVAVPGGLSLAEGTVIDVLIIALGGDGSRGQWESQLMVRDRKFL